MEDVRKEWKIAASSRRLNTDFLYQPFARGPRHVSWIFVTPSLDSYSQNEIAYSELRFLKITRQDEAEYQCIVRNSYGTAYSDRSKLLVRQLPEFLDTPKDIITTVGKNVGFPCRASGVPYPTISWEKDNSKTFPAAVERRMHILQNDHSLYILNVSKSDSGYYSCHASNDAGQISVSARLEVYGRGCGEVK